MTTKFEASITLGYDLDKWHLHGEKLPISIKLSSTVNSHTLICGMSGSGKSYFEQLFLAKLTTQLHIGNHSNMEQYSSEFYFSDFKADDDFEYLRNCAKYRSHIRTLELLDIVYERMNARISGNDLTRNPVTLVWDEYVANILYLLKNDKKVAEATMSKISEILLMGRSKNVRYVCSVQRPDALVFPLGSRLNYGIVVILGAAIKSIYEMLIPDHRDQVKDREFGTGEGVVVFQGNELRFIKVPTINNYEKLKQICVQALS